MTLPEALARIAELERDLELLEAARQGLENELKALKAGTMRGAAGLDGGTAEAKRQRFMKWPTRLKRRLD
jgi:predicted phage-related endonuclease